MERIARNNDNKFLVLDATITAELFYLRLGYRTLAHSSHALAPGCQIVYIKMRKDL